MNPVECSVWPGMVDIGKVMMSLKVVNPVECTVWPGMIGISKVMMSLKVCEPCRVHCLAWYGWHRQSNDESEGV